jgi:hypothetical protein
VPSSAAPPTAVEVRFKKERRESVSGVMMGEGLFMDFCGVKKAAAYAAGARLTMQMLIARWRKPLLNRPDEDGDYFTLMSEGSSFSTPLFQ